ncbi:hypothetical protein J2Z76_000489 [Sedimentibacter acidaminivorans]|uniref:Uncharacterized protein n=1 Tax=Sedimentibacter acidaminivorans TaxID=913099 RepID=A0ABS4GAD8_9FIRM|nr:hypothetical protein [Sedimentibacter acidaminivorans]MBP1924636.1 hypothetical protein [Sedimentibacter acidaminivorans]
MGDTESFEKEKKELHDMIEAIQERETIKILKSSLKLYVLKYEESNIR